jgi:hypothetical protein
MVAYGELRYPRPDCGDDARTLVPADDRIKADRHVAGGEVVIGVAEPGRYHLHLDFAGSGVGEIDLGHFPATRSLA